jgi:hypothetical protein
MLVSDAVAIAQQEYSPQDLLKMETIDLPVLGYHSSLPRLQEHYPLDVESPPGSVS